MNENSTHQNRLIDESSPYLQQHATNPVDWYPWGEEALKLARESNKPILLSIGYSACHWCHVMAHESFEDEATGRLMNDLFVNIKVDREERPDLDQIYQTAHRVIAQRSGGWPLTMFIDPENQRPFFGGTYFPDEARHGMPPFRDLITRVAEYFASNRDDVRTQGAKLHGVFGQLEPGAIDEEQTLNDTPLINVRDRIAESFDRDYGGFGTAPKFPNPTSFDRLLRGWRDTANDPEPDIDALFMVSLTLTRMAEGGIYDHIGGGFSRYSVDQYWQIPHFEKMLYDNGPLLALYAQLHIATGEPLFRQVANETADWMLDDMVAENGGFFSTRDADSEGEEGLFYVWTPEQVKALLPDDSYELFARRFGLDQGANFEGQWHLSVRQSIEDLAKDSGKTATEISSSIDNARQVLLRERATRVHPDRDEKQLTSWNALAIRGFAIAGRVLERPDLVDKAAAAVDFIAAEMMLDGRLLASHKDGVSRLPAYLDDHAFLLDALLELTQSRWNTGHMLFAIELADLLLQRFHDSTGGGFYFTADDHERLMHRPKPYADDATPSGNGIAAYALQRLGFILGETRYLDAAEKTLRSAWRAIDEFPHGHVSLVTALEEYTRHPEVIVIRGVADEIARWRDSAAKLYAPRRMVFAIDSASQDLPGALAERRPIDGKTVAYRCVGTHCSLPLNSWEALAAEMSESRSD